MLVMVVCFGFALFYLRIGLKIAFYYELLLTLFHIAWIFAFLNFKFKEMQIAARLYFNSILVLLYPLLLINYKTGPPTGLIYYILIPLGVMLFETRKKLVSYIVAVCLIASSIFFVAPLIDFEANINAFRDKIIIADMTVSMSLIIAFIAIFGKIIYHSEDAEKTDAQTTTPEPQKPKAEKNESSDSHLQKLAVLLDKIRNYYEQKQPYKRTDFSVAQLSDAIGANTFYIGQAISKTGMNFSEFTNNYRIDLVKAMIEDGYLDKFSITHLYEQAGFRSQSTFNENFKKIVGITPNEYRRRVKTLSDKKSNGFRNFSD
jgi:AraC-like DNA-binding protein